ncbi:hypothetical protein Gotur_003940 [Gossypium turneri]
MGYDYSQYTNSMAGFQEKDERLDGDASLNKFSRDIYQDADEDTRRAMWSLMGQCFQQTGKKLVQRRWKEVLQMLFWSNIKLHRRIVGTLKQCNERMATS